MKQSFNGTVHVNSFMGGMNLDLDYSVLEKSSYAYGENIRLITNGSDTQAVVGAIEGMLQISEDIPKFTYGIIDEITGEYGIEEGFFNVSEYKIIGITTIRDYTCIITLDSNGDNSIFRLLINPSTLNMKFHKIVSGKFNIANNEDRDFSIVSYWEDFDNIKVYWADGVHGIRYINIAEEADEKNLKDPLDQFESTLSSGTGIPQFVEFVTGSLEGGMYQYAYQLFDVNGGETNISIMSEMIQITKTSYEPHPNGWHNNFGSRTFPPIMEGLPPEESSGKSCKIKFEIPDAKFVSCKVFRIQYTNLNELPKIYMVGEFETTPANEEESYIQYFTDNSTELIEVTFEEFVTSAKYSFIPRIIESKDGMLFAGNIIESSWTMDGADWYDTRSFRFSKDSKEGVHSKILSNSGAEIIIKPEFFNLDNSELEKIIPKSHDCINPYNEFKPTSKFTSDGYNQRINVGTGELDGLGGTGKNVSYRVIYTKVGEDFKELDATSRSSFMSSRKNKLKGRVERINYQYSNSTGGTIAKLPIHYSIPIAGSAEYETPDYELDLGLNYLSIGDRNYSNPILSGRFRSYQRDELYRFGAVFYNSTGQASEVNWIADIRTPNIKSEEGRLFDQWERIDKNSYQVIMYPLGIEFEFNNLPISVDRIEIVRCKRDNINRRIVAQGLLSRTADADSNGNSDGKRPTRPLPLTAYNRGMNQKLNYYSRTETGQVGETPHLAGAQEFSYQYNNRLFTFISPEISHFGDDFYGDRTNLTGIEPLLGLASPIKKERGYNDGNAWYWHESGLGTIKRDFLSNEEYTSQVLFNPLWAEGNAGIMYVNHTSLDYDNGATGTSMVDNNKPLLFTSGYGAGQNQTNWWDARSKYFAKLYSPFTEYNLDGPDKSNLYEISKISKTVDVKYASQHLPEDYESVRDGGHKMIVGTTSYENWSPDRNYYPRYRSGGKDWHNKFKHGAHSRCWVFESESLLKDYKEIHRIGNSSSTVFSKYFNQDAFGMEESVIGSPQNTYLRYGSISIRDRAVAYALNATMLSNFIQPHGYYGGQDYSSRTTSKYISTQASIKIDRSDDNIKIATFGGDTFLGIHDVMNTGFHYHKSDPRPAGSRAWLRRGESMQVASYYPCESSINSHMIHGENIRWHANRVVTNKLSKNGNWNDRSYQVRGDTAHYTDDPNGITIPHEMSLKPWAGVSEFFTQRKDYYAYNSAYSSEPTGRNYIPKAKYAEDHKNYDYRIMWSEIKQNDELTDSWLHFKPANYLDLDTRFGSVNNLKLFNNTMYFWQDDAFGVLPINERALLQDSDFAGLLIGKGDVLSNYQYITQANGSKKDVLYNTISSPSTLYWYDHDRAEIMGMGEQLVSYSKTKYVQSWFNKYKPDISDKIRGYYDKKYNDAFFGFSGEEMPEVRNLILSEQVDAFSGFTSYNPDWYIDLKDYYYTFKNNRLYKLNANTGNNKFFDGVQYPSKLTYIVNSDYPATKTFDNVAYYAEFDSKNQLGFEFKTKNHISTKIKKEMVDLREDTYKFSIPRSANETTTHSTILPSSFDRMRGKYLISEMEYTPNNDDKVFKLPYIQTAYRKSNI